MSAKMKLATLAAITGNGIFGFSFMFSTVALKVAQPFVMLMYRFILAFAVLNIVAAASRRNEKFFKDENGVHWLRFNLKNRKILPLVLMGLIQPVAYFLCESYGISLTNATLSGVIIALIPIAALAGGFFTLGEKPKAMQVLFSIVSIAGVALMTLQQNSDSSVRMTGVVLLIGAVISGAAFNILSRKLSAGYSALERTYVMMLTGSVIFTILAVIQVKGDFGQLISPMRNGAFLISILYLGVFSSIVAFMCLNYANNDLPVARSTAFCNLTTVISMFSGAIFLHDPFNAVSLLAAALIIAGIWGVQRA